MARKARHDTSIKSTNSEIPKAHQKLKVENQSGLADDLDGDQNSTDIQLAPKVGKRSGNNHWTDAEKQWMHENIPDTKKNKSWAQIAACLNEAFPAGPQRTKSAVQQEWSKIKDKPKVDPQTEDSSGEDSSKRFDLGSPGEWQMRRIDYWRGFLKLSFESLTKEFNAEFGKNMETPELVVAYDEWNKRRQHRREANELQRRQEDELALQWAEEHDDWLRGNRDLVLVSQPDWHALTAMFRKEFPGMPITATGLPKQYSRQANMVPSNSA